MSDAFDAEEKRTIAGQARTLLERLDDPEAFEYRERGDPTDENVLERWRQLFPDEAAFDCRLERLGATAADCQRAVRVEKLKAGEPLPAWVNYLDELVTDVHERTPEGPMYPDSDGTFSLDFRVDGRPFGEFTAAIAASAYDRVGDDAADAPLGESAVESLFGQLREQVEEQFQQTLLSEFEGNVAAHDRALAAADPDDFDALPTEYYDGFVEYLFSGGFGDLCLEHPMLARLLATDVRRWERRFREFCTRLRSDRAQLADRFDGEEPLGDVVDIDQLSNDASSSSPSLLRVEFEFGPTVAYKARSVAPGATFYRVLDRLDDHLPAPDFDPPTYLSRDGYGWMEWLEHEPCPDEAAVERYYRRAGALACVAYLLGLADCAVDNLVAASEQPLLVDAETVLHPHVAVERKPTDSAMQDTVLATGLFPAVDADGDSPRFPAEMAGLGVSSEEAVLDGVTEPVVRGVNSDVMTVERRPVSLDRTKNVPTLDGADQPPQDYAEQLLDGFERAYEAVVSLRDDGQLFDDGGLLEPFETVETRFVYRSWYADVFESLTSAEALHDGARFGVVMERLAVPFCDGRVSDPVPWSLYDAERTALKRLEKPRFTCSPDEVTLRMDGRPVGATVDESGMERCRERLRAASPEDLNAQLTLLREALDYDAS